MSRVRPGVLLVRASPWRPTIALMALDLPAFERPAKATSAPRSAGNCPGAAALTRNFACGNAATPVVYNPALSRHWRYRGKSETMAKRAPLATAAAALLSCVWVAALSATPTGSPATATPPVTPDPYADGTEQVGATRAAVCFSCHGPNGNSQNPAWPRLAGQSAVYIAEQLHLFKAGVRQNPVMQPLAATLSDQDIDNVAVYFAAQTPVGLEA